MVDVFAQPTYRKRGAEVEDGHYDEEGVDAERECFYPECAAGVTGSHHGAKQNAGGDGE